MFPAVRSSAIRSTFYAPVVRGRNGVQKFLRQGAKVEADPPSLCGFRRSGSGLVPNIPRFRVPPPQCMFHLGLGNTQGSCQISGMLFADSRSEEVRTTLRQLQEESKTLKQELCLLRDSVDSRIVNLTSEWRQVLAELEDQLDKLTHQAQRLAKRRSREKAAPAVEGTVDTVDADPAEDEVTAKVKARRNALRTANVQR